MTYPRILFLSNVAPVGPLFGMRLRTNQTLRLLQQVGRVTIALMPREDVDQTLDPGTLEEIRVRYDLAMVSTLLRRPTKGLAATLHRELDSTYMGGHGWGVVAPDVRRLEELCESHDLIWVQRSLLADALGRWRWPRAVIDVDDLLSQYHKTRARRQRDPRQFLLEMRRSWLWRRREARLPERFASVVVCSEADKQSLGNGDRVHVVPNGFASLNHGDPSKRIPKRIGFIGAFGYEPNRDGVNWFIDKVWPRVRSQMPDAEFRIVGAGADDRWQRIDGVTVLGHLDQSCSELETWSCAVVPLQVGAGTRVKIAEAFARGLPVVSTSVGAFGYAVANGRELLLADRPDEFATACVRVCLTPGVAETLGQGGRMHYESQLSDSVLLTRVEHAIQAALVGPFLTRGPTISVPR
jgi:glycosyltransferase involved in cell wall biosynthesis